MELSLKELGLTLIVGAFAVLGFEAIVYQFFKVEFTGFLPHLLKRERQKETTNWEQNVGPKPRASRSRSMKAGVFIGLAFAVGLLSEDLSYKNVDTAKTPFTYIPHYISSKLPAPFNRSSDFPDKETSRVETLITDPWEWNMKVEPLAVDLARGEAFSLLDDSYVADGRRVEEWIKENARCRLRETGPDSTTSANREDQLTNQKDYDDCLWRVNHWEPNQPAASQRPANETITASINRLYYYAKNRVYLDRNYYDEMSRIEGRRDFARSIFLISIFLIIASVVFGVGDFIHHLFPQLREITSPPSIHSERFIVRLFFRIGEISAQVKTNARKRRANMKGTALTLLSICLILAFSVGLTFFAFERESDEFNKRAFGYFSSMLFKERLPAKKQAFEADWATDTLGSLP